MASLENILALNNLLPYMNDEQRNSMLCALGMTSEEFEHRIGGITKENEFLLILLFFDVCKNIAGFDEGISKLGEKTYTSDLVLELKNGMKFMLEIKHTDKDEFSISGGNLNKRIEYAASLKLDLYFAISIHGFWMLFRSDYLKKNNGKISVNDYPNSILDEVLDTYAYIFPSGIKIRTVYSKSTNKGMQMNFEPYGELVSFELFYKSRKLLRIKGIKSRYYIFTLMLTALQDRLSSIKQVINDCGNVTVIYDMDDGEHINYISEYLFMLSPIMHTKETTDEKKNATTVLNELKDNKSVFRFPKEKYRGMIQELVKLGIPIMYVRKGKIYDIIIPHSNN